MANSFLDAKRILAVDDDPGVLTILEEEILNAAPTCAFDKATNYQTATKRLVSFPYDLIILDVAFIRASSLPPQRRVKQNRSFAGRCVRTSIPP